VYAQQKPPPGFKTFNAKYHYDMHYGEGMMKEEIERARKRAEAASGRGESQFGHEYVSPLGKGFEFTGGSMGGNPYSKSGRKRMQDKNNSVGGHTGGMEIEYEEGYMDMGNDSFRSMNFRVGGREMVAERMKERRRFRRRNRGDPSTHENANNDDSCTIM
jgi:hypothetical protein